MVTPLLPFEPIRNGYGMSPGYGVISTKLDGGQSRKRLDHLDQAGSASVTWFLDRTTVNAFNGFFRETVQQGSLPFRAPLVMDSGVVVPHVCRCMNGLPRLTRQEGDGFWFTAEFEVVMNVTKAFLAISGFDFSIQDNGAQNSMALFPDGRQFQLDQCRGNTGGIGDGPEVDLDGIYVRDAVAGPTNKLFPVDPALVAPDWTVLAGAPSPILFPTSGVVILLPE